MAVNAATPNRSLREQNPTCVHAYYRGSTGICRYPMATIYFFFLSDRGTFFSVSPLYMIFSMVLIVLFCLSTSRLGNPCISPDTRGESSFIGLFMPRVDQRFQISGRFYFCHLHRVEGRETGRQIHRYNTQTTHETWCDSSIDQPPIEWPTKAQ